MMKNLSIIAICLVFLAVGFILGQNTVLPEAAVLPSNKSMSVMITSSSEINISTMQPYKVATLSWYEGIWKRSCSISEKEARPQWFKRLIAADGQTLTLQ